MIIICIFILGIFVKSLLYDNYCYWMISGRRLLLLYISTSSISISKSSIKYAAIIKIRDILCVYLFDWIQLQVLIYRRYRK